MCVTQETVFFCGARRGSSPGGFERNLGVAGSTPALGFSARLAQSVEHKTLMVRFWGTGNLGVAGSTPALGLTARLAQSVEHKTLIGPFFGFFETL
jgi:hypothetical protein